MSSARTYEPRTGVSDDAPSLARTGTIPRLDLPKFEFRGPALRLHDPSSARVMSYPAPDEPANVAVPPTPPAVVVAVDPVPTPAPVTAPYSPPRSTAPPASVPSAVDPSRMEQLRSDAMLGLVIGIGFAVIAAATIVALWSKLHGVPPGTY